LLDLESVLARMSRSLLLAPVMLALAVVGCARKKQQPLPPASAAHASDDGSEEIRYLALGDSFTAGTGSAPAEAFPTRLVSRWRAHGRRVTLENLAVNGYTTEDVRRQELPEVARFHPTLVTLAVGANDYVHGSGPDAYRSGVREIFREILEAGVTPSRVVALPQPDWSLSPAVAGFGDPVRIGADIVTLNGILQDEARAAGALYVDLYPLMHEQARAKMVAFDGLHPSARAHDEWAAALYERVTPSP
jgi:lysophospholipase L1-like esterase